MTVQPYPVTKVCTPFRPVAACMLLLVLSQAAWAQSSPFETGANSLVTEFIAIATPIAILLVMGLGIAAGTGRISWGWPLLVLLGIGVVFGAPQIVAWGRAIFGV
jgi:type IV secretion system protein VirB2